MFFPIPFPEWAPRLLTGNNETDSEHRLLLNTITRLNDLCIDHERKGSCSGCPKTQMASCNNELIDTLGDLLAFLVDHFYAEEQAMKKFGIIDSDRSLCDRHKEDHAAISDTVLRIVSALDAPRTVALIRQLHAELQTWLKNHVEFHDSVLRRMIDQR